MSMFFFLMYLLFHPSSIEFWGNIDGIPYLIVLAYESDLPKSKFPDAYVTFPSRAVILGIIY